ncbi:PAS domain S-box-containing protein [Desulfosporosinus hippei DSM 8344]|uniref:histidine kinase n=1 Tax=Desulfosporosinus hippei DSM 8344 TaxID=1121419 RepID=A0A1G8BIB9_9FIRM|nr:PAS domain S-box-containing protein [Desulfosporosinus hippei DSM 8344]
MSTDLEKQNMRIRCDIRIINNKRMKCLSIMFLILISIILLIDNNNRVTGLWQTNNAYKLLCYIHISYFCIAVYGILITYLDKESQKEIYLQVNLFLGLNMSSLLSGWVSPYLNGQISVYIICCLCISILFSLRPSYSSLLFIQSYLLLIVGLYINQTNLETFQANLMNASLVFPMALFISIILYRYTERELYNKYNLEWLVKERTSELLNANKLLKSETSEREQMQTEKIEQLTKYLTLEAELSRSNQFIADIIKNMPDGFFAIDKNWQITYINRAGNIAFAKSHAELAGKIITELCWVTDTVLNHFYEVLTEKKSVSFEFLSKELGDKWLEVRAYPMESGLTCYLRDITSRKITEYELARLDRLYLVGQLASGLAHEIRNPLTVVRGYLQLLGSKSMFGDQKSTFELMISELDRANAIITEFLSLAQIKQADLKTMNLNEILNNLYPLLSADATNQNKQIHLLPGEIPDLQLNCKEISQMVLNLVRNGLESMDAGRSLTIKSFGEDNMVALEIIDEGCGIPQENLNKLGTPFFTTKNYGTGLGLATSYRIAESHNAKIRVLSSSTGTSFCILFPIPEPGQDASKSEAELHSFSA